MFDGASAAVTHEGRQVFGICRQSPQQSSQVPLLPHIGLQHQHQRHESEPLTTFYHRTASPDQIHNELSSNNNRGNKKPRRKGKHDRRNKVHATSTISCRSPTPSRSTSLPQLPAHHLPKQPKQRRKTPKGINSLHNSGDSSTGATSPAAVRKSSVISLPQIGSPTRVDVKRGSSSTRRVKERLPTIGLSSGLSPGLSCL